MPTIETKLYGGKVTVKRFDSGKYSVLVDGEKVPSNGVTTILGIKDKSKQLVSWATGLAQDHLLGIKGYREITVEDIVKACQLHAEKKEEAANLGTAIHEWCEHYILHELGQGELPEMPDDKNVQVGAMAFLDFVESHKVQFISTERIIYSLKYGFSGKMDIEAIVDGKHAIVDLKTSNGLYNTVRSQTAAYLVADLEERNFGKKSKKVKYDTRWAIRISKETEDEYKERMAKKGKAVYDPYQVFEAMEFADGLEEDFNAFLSAKNLDEWDKKTDFYLLKKKAEKQSK